MFSSVRVALAANLHSGTIQHAEALHGLRPGYLKEGPPLPYYICLTPPAKEGMTCYVMGSIN